MNSAKYECSCKSNFDETQKLHFFSINFQQNVGVVECMAAGLIMVAHKSGGPMMDIVETLEPARTGFLATTETDYAQTLLHIIRMSPEVKRGMQIRARTSVDRFAEDKFVKDFLSAFQNVLE